MLEYAVTDVHYLLFLASTLQGELQEKGAAGTNPGPCHCQPHPPHVAASNNITVGLLQQRGNVNSDVSFGLSCLYCILGPSSSSI